MAYKQDNQGPLVALSPECVEDEFCKLPVERSSQKFATNSANDSLRPHSFMIV
jgi:hypothetical protein